MLRPSCCIASSLRTPQRSLLLQWLPLGSQLSQHVDVKELAWIATLGAVMEGVLNPAWNAMLVRSTARYGRNALRVRALRFALSTLIWTPICCAAVLVCEHVLLEDSQHLDLSPFQVSISNTADAARTWASEIDVQQALIPQTAEPVSAARGVQEMEGELADEVSASSAWQVVTSSLSRTLPAPLRPFLKRLANAGSWTVLDQLEP